MTTPSMTNNQQSVSPTFPSPSTQVKSEIIQSSTDLPHPINEEVAMRMNFEQRFKNLSTAKAHDSDNEANELKTLKTNHEIKEVYKEPLSIAEIKAKYKQFKENVRSFLDKTTSTTYNELIEKEFINLDISRDKHTREIAFKMIYKKVAEEHRFSNLYAKLCARQAELEGRSRGSFFCTFIEKVQAKFEGDSKADKKIKRLQLKLAGEMDDKEKAQLLHQITALKNVMKRRILGLMKFIGNLYTVNLLSDAVLSSCCDKLYQMFMHFKDDIYVRHGIELLKPALQTYFSPKKKEARKDHPGNVAIFISWLSTKECEDSVSEDVRLLIKDFKNFMKKGAHEEVARPFTIERIYKKADEAKDYQLQRVEKSGNAKKKARQSRK